MWDTCIERSLMSNEVTVTNEGAIVAYNAELRGPQSPQARELEPLALDASALPLNVIWTTSAEISGGAVLIDGAGAQFEAHVLGLQAVSVSKRTPDGAIVGDWLLTAPNVILSGPVSLSAAGNDLIVFVTGHINQTT